MASPNILNLIATSGGPKQNDGFSTAMARGESIRASQQNRQLQQEQQGQRNVLMQQGQEDRARKQELIEREKQLEPMRNDYAAFMQLPDDNARTQAWKAGLAAHYGQDPNSDWREPLANLTRQPGFLPPAIQQKMLGQLFAPKQFEPTTDMLNYKAEQADPAFAARRNELKTATQQFKLDNPALTAGNQRLQAIPDPASPTGYSYGVPNAGEAAAPPRGAGSTRLPIGALKEQKDSREALRAAQAMETRLGELETLVKGNPDTKAAPLEIGPLDRVGGFIADRSGFGSTNARGLNALKHFREKLRADYLVLSKGVQTEGDAQRAMGAMMPDTNDPKTLLQQINAVREQTKQLQSMHEESLRAIEEHYGIQPTTNAAPLQPGKPPKAPAAPVQVDW